VSKYALETVFVKIAKTGKVCGVNWHSLLIVRDTHNRARAPLMSVL